MFAMLLILKHLKLFKHRLFGKEGWIREHMEQSQAAILYQ
jgi:hypothetical protein